MEETQRPCKRVVDSQTEQTYLMRPNYLNCYGNLFGGQLMGWIDEIASIVAMRHCEADITTAAIDNLNFKEGFLNRSRTDVSQHTVPDLNQA